jgi:predicted RND superfamily exporter protein
VLVGWALVVCVSSIAILGLELDTTIGSALNRSDESWATYQESLARFGGDEFVTVALEGGEPFDSDSLRAVLELTNRFESLEFVRRVDSIATVPLIRRDGSDVRVDAGLVEGVLGDNAKESALWDSLLEDRIAPGALVSRDGTVVALNLVFDGDVDGDREAAMAEINAALDGRSAWLSGVPVVRAAAGERTRAELGIYVPLTTLLMAVILCALFGRAVPVAGALAVGLVGNCLVLASMVAGGTTLSFSTLILPSVVLALGCAYSMHIFTAAAGASAEGLRESVEAVAPAIALSGLTTALGFLAMATIRISLVRDLAFYGALGVLFVTLASLSLAVAMVRLWPIQSHHRHGLLRSIPRTSVAIVRLVARRRWFVRASWLLGGVLVVVGVSRIHVASDVILWFPEDSTLRRDYESIRSRLSGITPLNVMVVGSEGRSVTTPEVIEAIDRLSEALKRRSDVGGVLSVADPIRQIHEAFSEDEDVGLPSDQSLIDQYLLLLGDVEQLGDVLSLDQTAANLLLRVDENASADIVSLADWVDEWWVQNGLAGFDVSTTGIMFEFGQAQDEIAYGGGRGLGLALITVAGVLLAVFREWRIALVAMIPNALPVAIAFGAMGLLGIPIDAATVCLGGLALGIAVDDTIHVLSGFLRESRSGVGSEEALVNTFEQVLPALVFSTVAIAIGFGVLGLSNFTLVRNLGLMTSGVVVVCLIADLTLLPSLLLRARDR